MSEKMFNTRIQHKHDVEANWLKAVNFVPKAGELIVYDPDENCSYPRTKIGDGLTGVNDLAFIVVQADWNQNDETALDYVKNRTHWIEEAKKISLIDAETSKTLEFEEINEVYQDEYKHSVAIKNVYFPYENYNDIMNLKWYINWDGVEYEDETTDPDYDYYIIGNEFLDKSWWNDTGEPFVFLLRDFENSACTIIIKTPKPIQSFEFGYFQDEKAHTISADFLPPIVGKFYDYESHKDDYGGFGEVFNNYKENIASGPASHAEGSNTKAEGECSHAEGRATQANGECSHAEGLLTRAIGNKSHAEGYATYANGENSHAEGHSTQANGENSHAEGRYTIASTDCSHVQGRYNIEDTTNIYCHIVGNGSDRNNRSNAHTLDWQGNAWYGGNLNIAGGAILLPDTATQLLYKIEIKNGLLTTTELTSLEDFSYTINENGEYVLTGWNETWMGEESSELIIPNNNLIII